MYRSLDSDNQIQEEEEIETFILFIFRWGIVRQQLFEWLRREENTQEGYKEKEIKARKVLRRTGKASSSSRRTSVFEVEERCCIESYNWHSRPCDDISSMEKDTSWGCLGIHSQFTHKNCTTSRGPTVQAHIDIVRHRSCKYPHLAREETGWMWCDSGDSLGNKARHEAS